MTTALLAGTYAAAQSGLTPPQIGFLRDTAHDMRPLLGISGNFWMGDPVAADVQSAASSGRASMLKTANSLLVLDVLGHPVGNPWTATGTALFAFTPAGAPATVWLPEYGELLRWNGLAFQFTPVTAASLNGTVISLAAPDSSRAAFLVQREQLWRVDVSLLDGGVLDSAVLPGVSAPALLLDDGAVIYNTGSALGVRAPDQTERAIPFRGSVKDFTRLGQDWILIVGSNSEQFALRLSTGSLFELPETAQ